MIFLTLGLISVYVEWKAKMPDSVIIANAILMSAWAIMDKLWDIRICLTEIKYKIQKCT